MELARFIALPLVLISAGLSACASPEPEGPPPEAPDVKFKKAAVIAAVSPQYRKDVEDIVAMEIKKRRPQAELFPTWVEYPDLDQITEADFKSFLQEKNIDMVVTIVPFAETVAAGFNDLSDVAGDELGVYVEELHPNLLAGRFGVQVVGWDVASRRPVYARTSQILVGEVAGPQGVANFAVESVTRDL